MTKINEDGDTKTVIGESTPIRIGLIVAFLAVFGSGIWWASSISSKLDSIVSFQNVTQNTISEIKSKQSSQDAEMSDFKLQLALEQVTIKAIQDTRNTSSGK